MNRNLLFIAIALFTWGIGEGMFFNFQPIYLAELGSDPQEIGFILGAFGAAMAVTHIPAGHLADRLGRRPLLVSAWTMGLLSTLVMAMARDLPLFVVGMLGYGLTAFVASPLSSYTTAARGNWSVARVLTLTTATFNLGMVLGPVTGGWIGDRFGLRSVYFVAAAIFLVSTAVIVLIENQPRDQHDPESPPPGLLSNPRLLGFLGVYAFAVLAMYLPVPLTPNFLEGVRGLSLTQTGIIFTAGALGNALLAIFMGRFSPRLGFPLSQAMVGLFFLLIWRGAGLPVFALAYFLLGGFRAARPMAMAEARALVHDSQMGLTYGTMETIASIIFIIAPPLAGFIFERDPMALYPLGIGLVVLSILVSVIFAPRASLQESSA
ncbi:MAG: MFS transporter [Chloroflexota bacterium]